MDKLTGPVVFCVVSAMAVVLRLYRHGARQRLARQLSSTARAAISDTSNHTHTRTGHQSTSARTSASVNKNFLRVIQWNVFEDGLTMAPKSLGFSREFSERFDRLLAVLADDGQGKLMQGFAAVRDFNQPPPRQPLNSLNNFFAFIDVVYSGFYHIMGGETKVGQAADSPQFQMALRTLFLHTVQGPDGKWRAPDFDTLLHRALGPHPATAVHVKQMKQRAFDAEAGVLVRFVSADDLRALK